MPLCHVVTFTFTPETSTEWISEFGAALDELGAQTSTVSYRHGRDAALRMGNADYCVTAIFEDDAAFTTYITSPGHLRIVKDILTPHLLSRSAVQFSIDS
jgi:Stress responsive A/B Barrel Domain